MSPKEPIFVVGTGRCGSTALSDVIRTNPRWLGLSELFNGLTPGAFPGEPLTGAAFAAKLSCRRLDYRVLLANHLEPREFLYRVDDPGSRFTRDTGVPAISMTVLPTLSDEPDLLLDEVLAEVEHWPEAPIDAHYRQLFEWLRERHDGERWLERSGGSLDYLDSLLELFPEARFVHIYRAGADCALSMARHPSFRMLILRTRMRMRLGVDPYAGEAAPAEAGAFANLLPDNFDVDTFLGDSIPLWWFAGTWTSQIARGVSALASLSPERVLHMRYEDVVADPVGQVERFATFVDGDVDAAWAREAARVIARDSPGSSGELVKTARAIVERGEKVLREAGL